MKKGGKLPVGNTITPDINESNLPFCFVVSREEFKDLQSEIFQDVNGLSYEEYCSIESEGWWNQFKDLFGEYIKFSNCCN